MFLIPSQSFACGDNTSKSEKACCEKHDKAATEKEDCCKKHSNNKPLSSNHEKDDDCGGKCSHPSCSCPTFIFNFVLPFDVEIAKNNFDISDIKQKFYYNETYFSSGFLSVWLPQK